MYDSPAAYDDAYEKAADAAVEAGFVLDDDREIASVLRRSLKSCMPQLTVEAETDPTIALEQIERDQPDVVLLDLNMPKMNGVEVAMALHAMPHQRRPRIVGIRGSSQPATCLSRTSSSSFRLLITVYVRLSRANSICCGR